MTYVRLREHDGVPQSPTIDGRSNLTRRRRIPLPVALVEPIVLTTDCLLIVGASVAAGIAYHLLVFGRCGNVEAFFGIGLLVCINFAAILAAQGQYRIRSLVNFRHQMHGVGFVWTSVFLVLLAVAFSLKVAGTFSRGATMTFFVSGGALLITWRLIVARSLAATLAAGSFAERKILLIGEKVRLHSPLVAAELLQCGCTTVARFEISERESDDIAISPETVAAVVAATRRDHIDAIFLAVGWHRSRSIDHILESLRVVPIPIHVLPDENAARLLSRPIVHLGNSCTIELRRPPLSTRERVLKRTIDLIFAGFGLVLLFPLMLIVAALIKLDSPGPIFFVQRRNGFSGRSFRIFKFRTMRVLEDGPSIRQATSNDPRVTPLGRWLRKTSIDELPQLVNVLSGDMSLVGPRPHAAAHNDEYEKLIDNYAFRYHVKPGISGWAQVNGYRGETRTVDLMAQRVALDLWYIDNWSIWLDVRIMARSLVAAFN